MITFFTTAKPFRGHSAITQRNALRSWTLLHPDVEVILLGDDEGAAEVARELGIRYEPRIERHPSGLKYIDGMFDRAREIARRDVLCYVNCDIILTPDFLEAVQRARAQKQEFLMVGRRWDTDVTEALDFSNPRWVDQIRGRALAANRQRDEWWIDYFCFTRNLYYKQTPAFVIGRVRWDNWLVWKALHSRVAVVDASRAVTAVHQNHNYSYHPKGEVGVWTDELSQRNLTLAGGIWHQCNIRDANTILTADGLKPNRTRTWYAAMRVSQLLYGHAKRGLTYGVWLPLWHSCLNMSRPLRARLGLRSERFRRSEHKDSCGGGPVR
jgi:hypothetical protein